MTDEHLEKFRKIFKPKYNDDNDIQIYNILKRVDKIMNKKRLSKPDKEQLQRSKKQIIWLLKRKEK